MDAIVGEALAMYETAGTILGGRKVWALAALPREIFITDSDVIKPYLAMMLAHDGSHALHIKPTGTRIVCNNTYDMAFGAAGRAIRIEHKAGASLKLDEARNMLGLAQMYFEQLQEKGRRLTAAMISERMLAEYYEAVFPHPTGNDVTREDIARVDALHEKLAFLFHEGAGSDLPGSKGTAWDALNSVTEYLDHVAIATTAGTLRSGAMEGLAFGAAVQTRQRAMDVALMLI